MNLKRPPANAPALRRTVADLLVGGHAHATMQAALAGLGPAAAGRNAPRFPHTSWQLAEHIRIAQWDILEFTRDPGHLSPPFPQGYWPASATPPSPAAWTRCRRQIEADLAAMVALVRNPRRDLLAPLPHAPDKTLLLEALLLADHNAYHLGQLVAVRRALAAWR
ncbi:MAG: DinB family protein [Terriglobales bacterium]